MIAHVDRRRRLPSVWLLLILLAPRLIAEETTFALQISEADPVVIPEQLFKVALSCRAPTAGPAGPHILRINLETSDRALVTSQVTLDNLDQLARGVILHLDVPGGIEAEEVACRAVLHSAGSTEPSLVALRRPTWTALLTRLKRAGDALGDRVKRQDHLLPALWLEQALLAVTREPSPLATVSLSASLDHLEAWLEGRREWRPKPGERATLAYRCQIDGSVQPYRLALPAGDVTGVVLHLTDGRRQPDKIRWPQLPTDWQQAATDNGMAVLSWFSAGDAAWQGIATARVLRHVDALLHDHGLTRKPLLLCGQGSGAAGALRLVQLRPLLAEACLLIEPREVATPDPLALGLPAHQRDWLQMRLRLSGRLRQLDRLAIGLCGAGDPGFTRLRAQCETTGLRWLELPHPTSDEAAWRWLAAQASLPPATTSSWQGTILEPTTIGALQVLNLQEWGRPGKLRLQWDRQRLDITSEGVGQMQYRGPLRQLRLNGVPWSGDRIDELPGKSSGRSWGPACAYADGPFSVVVGSGDHIAAEARNKVTAQAFLDAWVRHAQGAPPWAEDEQRQQIPLEDRHLVCIGNPLSNALLADWVAQGWRLPLRWDHRAIWLTGETDDEADRQLTLRSESYSLVLTLPHPDDPRRVVVILDGDVGPWATGASLPLQGLPDLALIPVPRQGSSSPRVFARLFDSDWH